MSEVHDRLRTKCVFKGVSWLFSERLHKIAPVSALNLMKNQPPDQLGELVQEHMKPDGAFTLLALTSKTSIQAICAIKYLNYHCYHTTRVIRVVIFPGHA